jgi:glutamine amidotransferase
VQTVALIDYGSGNVHSAQKALERAARESECAAEIRLLADPDLVRRADRIVLPGVGAFADCRRGLDAVDGMVDALRSRVLDEGVPFLGICVGMQLMATRGLEFGETPGLDWIGGDVSKIEIADPSLKIPHMGWNTLRLQRPHAVFDGIEDGPDGWHAYFVHSFHMTGVAADQVLATADYGGEITAAVARDNLVGTQFHPEKSQKLGLKLLANFLNWTP